jgi:hypothetical protein
MSSKSQAYDIVGVSREVKVERSAVKEEDMSKTPLYLNGKRTTVIVSKMSNGLFKR